MEEVFQERRHWPKQLLYPCENASCSDLLCVNQSHEPNFQYNPLGKGIMFLMEYVRKTDCIIEEYEDILNSYIELNATLQSIEDQCQAFSFIYNSIKCLPLEEIPEICVYPIEPGSSQGYRRFFMALNDELMQLKTEMEQYQAPFEILVLMNEKIDRLPLIDYADSSFEGTFEDCKACISKLLDLISEFSSTFENTGFSTMLIPIIPRNPSSTSDSFRDANDFFTMKLQELYDLCIQLSLNLNNIRSLIPNEDTFFPFNKMVHCSMNKILSLLDFNDCLDDMLKTSGMKNPEFPFLPEIYSEESCSFERMFQYSKEKLLDMGVQLDTMLENFTLNSKDIPSIPDTSYVQDYFVKEPHKHKRIKPMTVCVKRNAWTDMELKAEHRRFVIEMCAQSGVSDMDTDVLQALIDANDTFFRRFMFLLEDSKKVLDTEDEDNILELLDLSLQRMKFHGIAGLHKFNNEQILTYEDLDQISKDNQIRVVELREEILEKFGLPPK